MGLARHITVPSPTWWCGVGARLRPFFQHMVYLSLFHDGNPKANNGNFGVLVAKMKLKQNKNKQKNLGFLSRLMLKIKVPL